MLLSYLLIFEVNLVVKVLELCSHKAETSILFSVFIKQSFESILDSELCPEFFVLFCEQLQLCSYFLWCLLHYLVCVNISLDVLSIWAKLKSLSRFLVVCLKLWHCANDSSLRVSLERSLKNASQLGVSEVYIVVMLISLQNWGR